MLDYLDADTARLGDTSSRSVTKAVGFTGIPGGIRGDTFDRPEADGVVEPANQYLGPRIFTVEGEVWGASVDAAWIDFNVVEQALLGMVQTQKLLKWRRAGGTVDVQALARLIDHQGPVLDASEQGSFLRYAATWRADDPTIYAQASQSVAVAAPTGGGGMPLPVIFPIPFSSGTPGGSVSARNGGNAYGWPILTIAGPINGPVVGNQTTGRFLYFDTLSLAAGESLIVTTAPNLRAAAVSGVSKLGALRFSDSVWPSMSPGVTETWQFYSTGGGTTGSTTLTVAWQDAYIS